MVWQFYLVCLPAPLLSSTSTAECRPQSAEPKCTAVMGWAVSVSGSAASLSFYHVFTALFTLNPVRPAASFRFCAGPLVPFGSHGPRSAPRNKRGWPLRSGEDAQITAAFSFPQALLVVSCSGFQCFQQRRALKKKEGLAGSCASRHVNSTPFE